MADIFQKADSNILRVIQWERLHPDLCVGFTTRNGGVSQPPYDTLNMGLHVSDEPEHVLMNREKVSKQLGFPLENWVQGQQIHDSNIHLIESTDRGRGSFSYDTSIRQVDGFITKETGILCTAVFADCVPIFFFDPKTSYIGIAHAGWQGTVKRIAEQMIVKFVALGAYAEDVKVAIGPCISQDNYEVDQHVMNRIPQEYHKSVAIPTKERKYLLDLKQLNMDILLQSGVLRTNIEVTNYCTYRHRGLFYSHRREQGRTGRMIGFIGYKS
ncbi:MAG TPA: peptidoglycan editing factor PgeF [Cerasibacillus sp.]|uniref:peptidoglycan editing factor PgeF n=1 Tax=Cerasibacillus sp. TaxID=2498711 RepID=UPI002F3E5327